MSEIYDSLTKISDDERQGLLTGSQSGALMLKLTSNDNIPGASHPTVVWDASVVDTFSGALWSSSVNPSRIYMPSWVSYIEVTVGCKWATAATAPIGDSFDIATRKNVITTYVDGGIEDVFQDPPSNTDTSYMWFTTTSGYWNMTSSDYIEIDVRNRTSTTRNLMIGTYVLVKYYG